MVAVAGASKKNEHVLYYCYLFICTYFTIFLYVFYLYLLYSILNIWDKNMRGISTVKIIKKNKTKTSSQNKGTMVEKKKYKLGKTKADSSKMILER